MQIHLETLNFLWLALLQTENPKIMLRWLPILLIMSLFGCAKETRQRVVVYSPHGKDLLKAYAEDFERQNPKVDVVWLDMGSQAIYERIRTESANPQACIWWGAPNITFQQAADEGLLAPYRPTWHEAISPENRDAKDRWYGTFLTPEGIAFNTETVDVPPQTWDDLLLPKWNGKILVRNPLESGTMVAIFGALMLRQPTTEQGYAWLARLDAQTQTYTADPAQLYIKLSRQEGDLSLWNLPDILLQQKKGNPFGIAFPANETPVLPDGIALVKGCREPVLARKFYEYVTSQEAMIEQAQGMYRIPARTDIPQDRLPEWIKKYPIHAMNVDWSRIQRESKTWMRFWNENIKGRGAAYLASIGQQP